jgi:signal transduction histidine kinase
VTDDGRPRPGADPAPPGAGHGIIGMRERAAVFGGEVSAGPRPGGGWRVRAVLRPGPEDA